MLYRILIFFIIITNSSAIAQKKTNSILKQLEMGFKKSDADIIAPYFYPNVEVSILGTDKIYSSNQAKFVLKTFFKTNKTKEIQIINQGTKKQTAYYYGELTTEDNTYRLIILLKENKQDIKIHQLRIEND